MKDPGPARLYGGVDTRVCARARGLCGVPRNPPLQHLRTSYRAQTGGHRTSACVCATRQDQPDGGTVATALHGCGAVRNGERTISRQATRDTEFREIIAVRYRTRLLR